MIKFKSIVYKIKDLFSPLQILDDVELHSIYLKRNRAVIFTIIVFMKVQLNQVLRSQWLASDRVFFVFLYVWYNISVIILACVSV